MTGERELQLPVDGAMLPGDLAMPEGPPHGLIVFAHGSGSGRKSPRNQRVGDGLRGAGLATLLFDLLTAEEAEVDARTAHLRFDIKLLADRLGAVAAYAHRSYGMPIGLFGASTGAAAALVVAAQLPDVIGAVVSRGGRPDLAGDALPLVRAPTLLVVGSLDTQVLALNSQASGHLAAPHEIAVVPWAGHLFEEPGKLDEVTRLAADWFTRHLPA